MASVSFSASSSWPCGLLDLGPFVLDLLWPLLSKRPPLFVGWSSHDSKRFQWRENHFPRYRNLNLVVVRTSKFHITINNFPPKRIIYFVIQRLLINIFRSTSILGTVIECGWDCRYRQPYKFHLDLTWKMKMMKEIVLVKNNIWPVLSNNWTP